MTIFFFLVENVKDGFFERLNLFLISVIRSKNHVLKVIKVNCLLEEWVLYTMG